MKHIKHKEVRIALVVVVLVFIILLIQAMISRYYPDHLSAAQNVTNTSSGEPVSDGQTEPAADIKQKKQSAGPVTLNHHLLEAEAYRQSAENGDAQAQYEMGEAYRHGQQIPDDNRALYWYRLSAAQGYALALYQLGEIYEAEGKQRILIYALYRAAVAYSDTPLPVVEDKMKALMAGMTPGELKAAEDLSKKLQNNDQFEEIMNEALASLK